MAILCYNHEAFIAKALDSVLMQKVDFPYEIIIGDDASTDKSQQILQAYQVKHPDKIKLILKTKNEGVFKNITGILKACSGQYIALLETDDFWTYPHKLARQVAFLDQNPDYTGCFHNTAIEWIAKPENLPNLYMKNFRSCVEIHVYPKDFHPHHLMNSTFIPTSALVFKRRDYHKELETLAGINHSLAWGMAYFFIKEKINKGGKFRYINEIWSTYMKNEQSLTFTKKGSTFTQNCINILKILLKDPFYKYYKSEVYRGLALQHEMHLANLRAENAQHYLKTIFNFFRYSILFTFYRTSQFLKQK